MCLPSNDHMATSNITTSRSNPIKFYTTLQPQVHFNHSMANVAKFSTTTEIHYTYRAIWKRGNNSDRLGVYRSIVIDYSSPANSQNSHQLGSVYLTGICDFAASVMSHVSPRLDWPLQNSSIVTISWRHDGKLYDCTSDHRSTLVTRRHKD